MAQWAIPDLQSPGAAAQSVPTIRVRAVIAISADNPRRWSVIGSDDSTDTDVVNLALDGMPRPSCLRWLEVDVPVPAPLNPDLL